MTNELLLIGSLVVSYGAVLLAWRLFGKAGMYAMTAFFAVAANVEVQILIHAFGMDQTLGNILFAASFIITDILSENESKKAAKTAVNIGILTSVLFIVISQGWLLYHPADDGAMMEAFRMVFSGTPRIMLASIAVYVVSQRIDVWLYHRIWALTEKKSGSAKRFLWLRNNAATLISQLINTVLFTLGAFLGTYSFITLFYIMLSSYAIFIVTSLLDTPVVYLARRFKGKNTA